MDSLIEPMLEEVRKYSTSIIRHVYGDWMLPTMQSWRSALQELALNPAQQFANVSGKSVNDSALIIEAMGMLHKGVVDGSCIVSCDSDFTSMAKHSREEYLFAMAIGRAATTAAFSNTSRVIVASENLVPAETPRKRGERRENRREIKPERVLTGIFGMFPPLGVTSSRLLKLLSYSGMHLKPP